MKTRPITDNRHIILDNGIEVQSEINSFVSKTTLGFIDKILEEPLEDDTEMASVNALYFKGSWLKPMNPRPSEARFNDFPK